MHSQQNCEEVLLWGKITGVKNDYYIAVGVTYTDQFEFPNKKFFYCLSNDFTFAEMPDLNDQHKEFIDRDDSFFTGEPKRKLIQKAEGEEQQEEAKNEEEEEEGKNAEDSELSEQEEVSVPPKELTELDRLKYVVYAIENDCQIAPLGSFKMTAQHQVRRNEAFKGLNASESLELRNYVHFRNVQDAAKKAQLDEPSAPFNRQFLESISLDKPHGCWNF